MGYRIAGLLACAFGIAFAGTEAVAYPQIDFQPESARFNAATEEYREIWRTEGERISAALQAATGLEMEAGPIPAIVYGGISNSGYKRIPCACAPATRRTPSAQRSSMSSRIA